MVFGHSLRNPKMVGGGPFVGYKGRRLLTVLPFPYSPTSNPQRSPHVLHKISKQPSHSQDEGSCSSKPTQPTLPPVFNLTSRQSLIAAATLSGSSAAAALGYISAFGVPDCVTVGGVAQSDNVNLPMGTCAQIPEFTSFRGGVSSACPKGKTPAVMAYSGDQCDDGTSVSAGTLPTDGGPGDCTEIAVEVANGGATVGGRSAKFTCS